MTRHGFKDATRDPEQIEKWWTTWPDANIGGATGVVSGRWVLDIDPRNGGDESLDEKFPGLESTVESLTGGGGRHLVFQTSDPVPCRNGDSWLPGVDVKGDGGYVILPPSLHPSGLRYEWEISHHPDENRLCLAPAHLINAVLARAPKRPGPAPRADEPIIEGGRNDALARIAGSLRRQGLSEEGIFAALLSVNQERCVPPLGEDEVRRIARSVARYEPSGGASTDPSQASGLSTGEADDRRGLTDLGNCYRLVDADGEDLRYSKALGWLSWDGARWRRDYTGEIDRRAKDAVLSLLDDASAALKNAAIGRTEAERDSLSRRADELHRFAMRSQNVTRIKAVVTLAESEDPIAVSSDAFDGDPYKFNVQNGTLNLHTGELRPHSREDHITKLAPVDFDPAAICPRFERFLLDTFKEDLELYCFVQRLIGYAMIGEVKENVFAVAYGTGANGKTTLFNTLRRVFGDYATEAASDLLIEDRAASRHPTEKADLQGRRLVTCSELPDGTLSDNRIKSLTGGEPIKARYMRRDLFEFMPSHTLIASTNHKPRLHGTDHGLWRRVYMIPFENCVAREKQDLSLQETLAKEASGILKWCLQGCRDWQAMGLAPPEAVLACTESYRMEMDRVGAFLESETERDPAGEAATQELYSHYRAWSEESGYRPLSIQRFTTNMEERGCEKVRATCGAMKGRWSWSGIRRLPRSWVKESEGLSSSFPY